MDPLDAVIRALEKLAEDLNASAKRLANALIRKLEQFAEWVDAKVRAVLRYLWRLTVALARTAFALCKIGVFYVPAAVLALLGYVDPSGLWLVWWWLAGAYAVVLTGVLVWLARAERVAQFERDRRTYYEESNAREFRRRYARSEAPADDDA